MVRSKSTTRDIVSDPHIARFVMAGLGIDDELKKIEDDMIQLRNDKMVEEFSKAPKGIPINMVEIDAKVTKEVEERRKILIEEAHQKALSRRQELENIEKEKRLEKEKEENERRARLEKEKKEAHLASIAKRKRQLERMEKAKAKKAKELEKDPNYVANDEEEEIEEVDEDVGTQEKEGVKKMSVEEKVEAFLACGFRGTTYPDLSLLEDLAMRSDFEDLMDNCGLGVYVTKVENTFPEAAAWFLATCKYSDEHSPYLLEIHDGGHIDFQVFGKNYMVTLRQINDHFGFKKGATKKMKFVKGEVDRVWKFLSDGDVFTSGIKGGPRIRSPIISYVRKAIAETFYSRVKTGPPSVGDMHLLINGLRNHFGDALIGGHALVGDTEGTCLAFTLAKHLESYRSKLSGTINKESTGRRVSIGGVVTALMRLAGVKDIDFDAVIDEKLAPQYMDKEYLHLQYFLGGDREDPAYYYRFLHEGVESLIELPNSFETCLDGIERFRFFPSLEFILPFTKGAHTFTQEGVSTPKSSTKKKVASSAKGKGKVPPPPPSLSDEQMSALEKKVTARLQAHVEDVAGTVWMPQIIEQITPVITQEILPLVIRDVTTALTSQITERFHSEMVEKLAPCMLDKIIPFVTSKVEKEFERQRKKRLETTSARPQKRPRDASTSAPPTTTPPAPQKQKSAPKGA